MSQPKSSEQIHHHQGAMQPIIIKSVKKSYSSDQNPDIEILKGVDLEVGVGSTAAILGPSGSGKTTLLSIIAGLDNCDSGQVSIAGSDITGFNEEQLAEFRKLQVGIVFQQYHLLPSLTALENISLPLEILGLDNPEAAAREVLEQVGLKDRGHHFPRQLSGGEKQRVAIGRAIVHRPKLLLADEPSGNLDNATGERIMNLLFDLVTNQGLTMILVTHSESLAQRCSRIYRLGDGVLQEEK